MKTVCVDCFKDEFIRRQIQSIGVIGTCSYCEAQGTPVASITDIGLSVRRAVDLAYDPLDSLYPVRLPLKSYSLDGYEPTHLIATLTIEEELFAEQRVGVTVGPYQHIHIQILNDIIDATSLAKHWRIDLSAEKAFTHVFPRVVEVDTHGRDRYALSWQEFRHHVLHYTRFLGTDAEGAMRPGIIQPIAEVLAGLGNVKPAGWCLWRSRVMTGHSTASDVGYFLRELGPAPISSARANRMSPAGISYTYLAENSTTCISEIRPYVGDYVWSGKFETVVPLRVIDLGTVQNALKRSIFDPDYEPEHSRLPDFFQVFSRELSRPLSPDDAQLGYVPTQVLCEYLRVSGYNGLRYQSSQSESREFNVVLFCGPIHSTYPEAQHSFPKLAEFTSWLRLLRCDRVTITGVSYDTRMAYGGYSMDSTVFQ